MPTPVSTARQCLTPEAASLLDEAVSVARRRSHSQTTSLHAVSALLSLPNSSLRESCARARNSAYSPRLQFKALELSLSVSLDRVNSSRNQNDEEPLVSNSFMAAIKRSQANQRRQPENFHMYQQIIQQQNSSYSSSNTISCIKVELRNLILSILDDPVVSRVFMEAGFRSSDIKMGILRPLPQLLKYSRVGSTRIPPPLFLCNLSENLDPGQRSFSFSAPGFSGFQTVDENCRRIGEVLAKRKGKNPLLVGVCAYDALKSFIGSKKDGSLPSELTGLDVVCIEKEVLRFVSENYDEWSVGLRFEEVGKMAEDSVGTGLVVNIGDLQGLLCSNASINAVNCVVQHLTKLLDSHGGNVRLIGSVSSYEMYLKFVSGFPSIEKDWDLQLLPITSLRQTSVGFGDSYSRSSLMESFVPFAGFLSAPDLKGPLSSSYQCVSRFYPSSNGHENGASVTDQYTSSLPSWLQMAELSKTQGLDAVKAKDDRMSLSEKISGLRHHSPPSLDVDSCEGDSLILASEDGKGSTTNCSSHSTNASPAGNGSKFMNAGTSINLNCISSSNTMITQPMMSKAKKGSLLSKLLEKPLEKCNDLEASCFRSPISIFSTSSIGGDGDASPASATSVTTDLGLGILSSPSSAELKKSNHIDTEILLHGISGCFADHVDLASRNISNHLAKASSCSYPEFCDKYDLKDFKMLFRSLSEKCLQQGEAIAVISQAVAYCRMNDKKGHGAKPRGDIWLNFHGPDRFGKKKIAVALAEILYGSRDNFICADLSSLDMTYANRSYDLQEMNVYTGIFRGKSVIDYVAEELSKNSLAVVFLENVDKADPLAQNSLSRAIRTGKFSDSDGREVGINNAIFITTSGFIIDDKCPFNYPEERAKSWPFQILVGCALENNMNSYNSSISIVTGKDVSNPVFVNKRKNAEANDITEQYRTSEVVKRAHKTSNMNLDLNLPAEKNEEQEADYGNSEDCSYENSKHWLEDFINQVDETVVFKPLDFAALAEKLLRSISETFHKLIGSQCLLEIDSEVMDQLLVADHMSEKPRMVEDWVEQVLGSSFVEVTRRYTLNSHSVVKLATHKGLFLDKQAPYLPTAIILN